ncbi:MAG TPA: hypothetical protein VGW09_03925 [Nitrososphaeraceae archaeon]|nr:hypothetical protein [Nitrososphaeraceae archaeon]
MTDVDNDNNEKEPEGMIPFFSIASRDFERDLGVLKKILHQFEQRTHSEYIHIQQKSYNGSRMVVL